VLCDVEAIPALKWAVAALFPLFWVKIWLKGEITGVWSCIEQKSAIFQGIVQQLLLLGSGYYFFLPENLDALIFMEITILRDDNQFFKFCLSDDDPIEWISMLIFKIHCFQNMLEGYRKQFNIIF
jgi:hypothetical protein